MRTLWKYEWDGAGGLVIRATDGRRKSMASAAESSAAGSDAADLAMGPQPTSTRSRRSMDSPTAGPRSFDFESADRFMQSSSPGLAGEGPGAPPMSFATAMHQAREASNDLDRATGAVNVIAAIRHGVANREAFASPNVPVRPSDHPASHYAFALAARDDWIMVYHAIIRHAMLCKRGDADGAAREAESNAGLDLTPLLPEQVLDRMATD